MKYLKDPDTGKQSVSLTSYIIGGVLVVAACSIDFFKNGYNPDNFFQLFLAVTGLYFGRRFDFTKYKKGVKSENSKLQGQGQKVSARSKREIDQGD